MPDKLEFQEITGRGLFPGSLVLLPPDLQRVMLDNYMRRSLSMIHGIRKEKGYVAEVDQFSALRTQSHGTGFVHYAVVSGTAPAAFAATDEVNDTFTYHRWDILVETEQAEIRFVDDENVFGDAIPLTVGFHSILFTSFRMQIKYRNSSAGTYTITAYRGNQ